MYKSWLNTTTITFIATYVALVFGLQVSLSFIPNIETTTLLLIVCAMEMPLKVALLITFSFVGLEITAYGFNSWVLLYLIIWPLLIVLSSFLKGLINRHWWIIIIFSATFGLFFGTIDALIKGVFYGFSGMLAYWINGFIFDLVHCVGNIFVALFCYKPVSKVVRIYSRKYFEPNSWRKRYRNWLLN